MIKQNLQYKISEFWKITWTYWEIKWLVKLLQHHMCLVVHSGNTFMWKLLQLSDQKKIITQITCHEVVQNMQRAFC